MTKAQRKKEHEENQTNWEYFAGSIERVEDDLLPHQRVELKLLNEILKELQYLNSKP